MQNTEYRTQSTERGQNLMMKLFAGLVLAGMIWVGQTLIPNNVHAYPYAYVTNYGSSTVLVIDTQTNQVIGSPIPVGSGPQGIAITPDGRYAYVTNYGSNTVSVIDMTTNQVIGSPIPVGSNPRGVAITPDGRYAYVTNYGSHTVSVIDTATNQVVGSAIPVGSNPYGVAITPDGRYAYVTNVNSNTVSVIDTATNQVVGSATVGTHPYGVAITPDGRYAYVTNRHSDNVSVIDTATNQVVGSAIPVGSGPNGVAITPDGRYTYVTNANSNNVSVIDTATNQVVGSAIPVGSYPEGVAITPDGRYAYVTNVNSANVSVIDTAINQVVGSPIPVGSNPYGVAITPLRPTSANTQIINGTDTGTLNEADTPGDVLLSYTSTMGNGTITCNQVSTTVEQVYGLSHLPQPADKSGTYNTTIYYSYWIRNTGNGTDTITLTPGNSWASTIIHDDNQDGVRQGTETTVLTSLTLAPNQFNYFFLAVQIPSTATTGQQSTTILTARDNNGAGTDDNWGYPDTRTDEVVTLCSVGLPAVITITKTRDKSQVKPGGTITYTLTYRNNTGSPATEIVIIDAVPANTILAESATGTNTTIEYYVSNTWTPTFSSNATKVKWTRTTPLSAISEATVSFTVKVK